MGEKDRSIIFRVQAGRALDLAWSGLGEAYFFVLCFLYQIPCRVTLLNLEFHVIIVH